MISRYATYISLLPFPSSAPLDDIAALHQHEAVGGVTPEPRAEKILLRKDVVLFDTDKVVAHA